MTTYRLGYIKDDYLEIYKDNILYALFEKNSYRGSLKISMRWRIQRASNIVLNRDGSRSIAKLFIVLLVLGDEVEF